MVLRAGLSLTICFHFLPMYLGFHLAVAQARRLHLGRSIKNLQLCSPTLRTTDTEWPYIKPLFLEKLGDCVQTFFTCIIPWDCLGEC